MTDHPIGHRLYTFPTEPLPGLWAWVSPCGYRTIGRFYAAASAVLFKFDERYTPNKISAWEDGDYLIRLDGMPVEPRRLGDVPREALERNPYWMVRITKDDPWYLLRSQDFIDAGTEDRYIWPNWENWLIYPIRHTESGVERVPWAEVL